MKQWSPTSSTSNVGLLIELLLLLLLLLDSRGICVGLEQYNSLSPPLRYKLLCADIFPQRIHQVSDKVWMHAKPYPELNCVGLKCTTRLKLCSTVVKGFVTKTYLSVVFSCLSQLPTKIIKIKDINLLFFIRNNKTLQVKCLLATDAMFLVINIFFLLLSSKTL